MIRSFIQKNANTERKRPNFIKAELESESGPELESDIELELKSESESDTE